MARTADASADLVFERSAAQIASDLHVAVHHDEDVAASTGAYVVTNPNITTAELTEWLASVRAAEDHSDLLAVAVMSYVSSAELPDFIARIAADPARSGDTTGPIEVVPPGERTFYCLLQAVVSFAPGAMDESSWGLDYCAGGIGPLLLAARDSGHASTLVLPSETGNQLVVQSPMYRGGVIPSTVEGRRAAYLGSLGIGLAPDALLADVVRGHPDETISMRFSGGAEPASFGDTALPPRAESFTEDLGNGWAVTVSHSDLTDGLQASPTAIALMAAGSIASLLLGMLIFSLGTGRRRAVRLVAARTDELRHQALHDGLTHLPNRTLILDRVAQMLVRCRRNGGVGAALFLDLDGFKSINDTLGHEAGDQLLLAVAQRLTTSLRGIDTIGRLGGDEFVVLVDESATHTEAGLVAERILDLLREPFELDLAPAPIVISTSIGIAIGDRGAPGDLLRDADIALYEAKEAGRNRYERFRPDMEAAVQHQFELEFDLRSALQNDQFRLHYQPIYDLSDLSIVGAEALIRWEHPTRGLVQPDDFIPLLEASGQIVDVGRWVLIQACRQAQQWIDNGDDLTVSVNVSARQLDHDSIFGHVREALHDSGLDPAHLTIEITETTLMKDAELAAKRLRALRILGVKIAIDDFGTGYSSLAYLQRFPVDCLKIDRTFTSAITGTAEADALVHTLVQLGKDLGLQTVAEGVETSGQLDHLRGVAVDRGQGFLLARPMDSAAFESKLLFGDADNHAATSG